MLYFGLIFQVKISMPDEQNSIEKKKFFGRKLHNFIVYIFNKQVIVSLEINILLKKKIINFQ